MKRYFKMYDKSLMGHLNYFGMILFSLFVVLVPLFYPNIIAEKVMVVFTFFVVHSLATANINGCILPYGKQAPSLLYISRLILLKHLFFSIKQGYALQLTLALCMSLFLGIVLGQIEIVILAIATVIVSFLSKLTFGLFSILIRVLFLLECLLVISSFLEWILLIILAQLILIYVSITFNFSIYLNKTNLLSNSLDLKYRPRGILGLLKIYLLNNIWVVLLVGVVSIVIGYFGQPFANRIESLPVLMFFQVSYITVVEILIGAKPEEIMIDKSRTEMMQVINRISLFKKFESSTMYLFSLILIIICIFGLFGAMMSISSNTILFKNIISIPMSLLAGVIYFRKSELLLSGNESKMLKMTLPIMFLIMTAILTFV
ncbi:hypothetical protein P4283_09060 [Bacillus thuringiensis]|nr:hypothetical protein [Bacillus thuringiensis]